MGPAGRWHYCAVRPEPTPPHLPHRPPAVPARRPPWRAWAALLPAVLALHLLVLTALPADTAPAARPESRPALQVRVLTPAPVPTAEPVAEAPAIDPTAPAAPTPRPRLPGAAPAPAPAPDTPPARVATAAPAPPEPADPAPPAAEPVAWVIAAAPAAAASAAAGPEAGGAPPPVYATRLPPPLHLQYALRRGAMSADADLQWRPAGDRYEASFEGSLLGMSVIAWNSRGGFDSAGIAPERFVDRRRARSAQAANFQRASGRITFSGPGTEVPLVPGAQDRLTWMLQLAGIVEAAPQKFGPGATLAMFVVGARGDAEVWTFDVEAREGVAVARTRVEGALRLRREPRKPYDTRAEVWLDPARHHVPVKVRLEVAGSGEVTEFALTGYEPR